MYCLIAGGLIKAFQTLSGGAAMAMEPRAMRLAVLVGI
jgi:hypothetical protein